MYLNRWISFCKRKNFSPLAPKLSQVLEFLTTLFDSGLGYSGMNTARSALSAVVEIKDSNHTIASHPLVQRFLKAVFQSRPSLPKYSHTWDVTIVLDYLKTIAPKEKLTLKQLTQKLAMLCLLVTGNRCQSLALMDINTMFKEKSSYKFPINELVKQSRPGKEQPVLVLPAYPVDRRLCVYTYLTEYLSRTNDIRKSSKLFISCCRPHNHVSTASIGRWIKNVMSDANIDIDKFKAHSVRSASTNAAISMNVPIDTVMKTAGWSRESTFSKYYKKPLLNDKIFGTRLLDKSKH